MFVAFVFAAIVVFICYKINRYIQYNSYFKNIPSESGYPLIGNVHKLGKKEEFLSNLLLWWKKFNYGTFKIQIGLLPVVILSDPKDVEVILSSTVHIDKMSGYHFLEPWLGQGLITGSGPRWVKYRKIITPTFHFNILQSFLEIINENSVKFIDLLRKEANGRTFDCHSKVNLFSMDVICETAMGVKMNAMANSNSEILRAIDDVRTIMQERVFNLKDRFDILFKLTKKYKRQTEALETIKLFNEDVILKRKMLLETKTQSNNSDDNELRTKRRQVFLDTLLTATVDGNPLPNNHINEEVSTFIFAGHDTSAIAISFGLYCLSLYPDVQKSVFEEQYALFGNDLTRCPTFSEIQAMNYLDLFIKESQRLFPSVPLVGRHTTSSVNINGLILPPDSNIAITIFGMNRNPNIFKNPEEFNPTRFLPENRLHAHPYEYIPFSAGSRNCIGQKFALLELKVAFSMVVRNFVILSAEDKTYKPRLSVMITLKSENGILISLKPRI